MNTAKGFKATDTGSWMLVAQAAQDIAGVLPVLLARPAPDGDWPGMERLALTVVDRLRLRRCRERR